MSWDIRTHYATATTTSGFVFTSCTPAHVVRKILTMKFTLLSGDTNATVHVDKVEHGTVSTIIDKLPVLSGESPEIGYFDPRRPVVTIHGSGNLQVYTHLSGMYVGVAVTYVDDTIY